MADFSIERDYGKKLYGLYKDNLEDGEVPELEEYKGEKWRQNEIYLGLSEAAWEDDQKDISYLFCKKATKGRKLKSIADIKLPADMKEEVLRSAYKSRLEDYAKKLLRTKQSHQRRIHFLR